MSNSLIQFKMFDSFGDGMGYTGGVTTAAPFGYTILNSGGGIIVQEQDASFNFGDETENALRTDETSSINDLNEFTSLNVFPNPTSGQVQVQFVMPATQNQEVSLKISDMLGRTLSQEQLGNFSGNYNGSLDLKAFGPGIYMLQLQVGNELLYKKVIVR
jgi:hypothetical protein